ncbi:hypothetical protein AV530_018748 [Patagioenas fasciata monilis]|uniref:Uncharacterized protein n=1 Tax=Patagioenas fasciata monilis TaxID=372326 RepID=A0A1V4JJM5_PATFA|nr:hypothetical protein AV530_018748 [Patagioenas fasciata monilis]
MWPPLPEPGNLHGVDEAEVSRNDSRVLKRWAFMCAQLCETPWCKETLQVVRSMASVQRSRTLCHKTFFFHGFVGLQ